MKKTEEEIWKDIPGYEGLYQVSNFGRVKSLNNYRKKIILLKPQKDKKDYLIVNLCKKGKLKAKKVHKLVAEAFVSKEYIKKYKNENINYEKIEVNHIDENKSNNHYSNLEWCTHSYNTHYGTGIIRMGEKHKRKIVQIGLNDEIIKTWGSIKEASEELNITKEGISACCRKKSKTSGKYKWRYANE
jgi:hypothetical protein